MNNGLDKYFKDQLADNELAPSPQVWERIKASGVIGEKKQPAGWRIVRLAAAAAVLLLIGVTAFWSIRHTGAEQVSPAVATNTEADQKKPAPRGGYESPAIATERPVEEGNQSAKAGTDDTAVAIHEEIRVDKHPGAPKGDPVHTPGRKKQAAATQGSLETVEDLASHAEIADIALTVYTADLAAAPLAPVSGIGLPVAVSSESLNESFALELYLLPLAGHGITPYGEEGIWAAHEDPYEQSMPQKLIKLAGGTITELAEAAGLPVKRWSRITEIEILY